MKQLIIAGFALTCVIAAVAMSDVKLHTKADAAKTGSLEIISEDKNPWTNLKINTDPDMFQFAIVSDRTGGHRPKVFSRAVKQLNLLQPEFVLSVGDLIEGYTTKQEVMDKEWKEFNGYTQQLQMPFFYVPGNHDLANDDLRKDWKERFGRQYYHFTYKNALFLAVSSEDTGASVISAEQTAYFKKVLADNPNPRWTFVFLHKPMWVEKDLDKNGWNAFEKLIEGRKCSVFCGHVHRFQKFVRNGNNYYQLATTGGGSRMRGMEYGEFDQITWITQKKGDPIIAHLKLDGILPENLEVPDSAEEGVERKLKPLLVVKGKVTVNGKPLAKAVVGFHEFQKLKAGDKFVRIGDGYTDTDGNFIVSTYTAFDGLPAGEYSITVTHTGSYYGESLDKNTLNKKYASPTTTTIKAKVEVGMKQPNIEIDLKD